MSEQTQEQAVASEREAFEAIYPCPIEEPGPAYAQWLARFDGWLARANINPRPGPQAFDPRLPISGDCSIYSLHPELVTPEMAGKLRALLAAAPSPAAPDIAPAFPPPHKAEQIAKDCGALLRRWCYQAGKSEGDNSFKVLKGKTDDYLRRVSLQGSPLRQDEPEQATATDIAQIRARFEAWAIRTGRTTMQQASAYDRGGDMFACWCAALGITP